MIWLKRLEIRYRCGKVNYSMGGRLILIKRFLQSIPMYILAILDPPKHVLVDLDWLFVKFWWGSCEYFDKRYWISWENVCRPTLHNGLDIYSLHHPCSAFSSKLWWCFCTKDNLWSHFMHSKYSERMHIYSHPSFTCLVDSHTWKRMITVMEDVEPFIGFMSAQANLFCGKTRLFLGS